MSDSDYTMHVRTIICSLTCLLCAPCSPAQDVCPGDRAIELLADDGQRGDRFGRFVAASGDVIVVGAHLANGPDLRTGAVYTYERNSPFWIQKTKLIPKDGDLGDAFGWPVAIDGDTLVAGAWGDDDLGSDSGSVYVFERSGDTWRQSTKLLAPDGEFSDRFGRALAIDNNTLVIGARYDDDRGFDAGSAYVYQRVNGSWFFVDKIFALDGQAGEQFGISIAIYGDTIAIGSRDNDRGTDAGAVYIFERVGNTWMQSTKLLADDGQAGDSFGLSVAIDGKVMVIGAENDDDRGDDAGAVYIFERMGGAWRQVAKLLADDGQAGDNFGFSVAIQGNIIVVGALGDDDIVTNAGSAYIFERVGSAWLQKSKLLPSDEQMNTNFGVSVTIGYDIAVVGAWGDNDLGPNAGSAYLFPLNPTDCCADIDRNSRLDASDFFLFLDLFASADLRADFTEDGVIDTGDFFFYLDLFALGCP